ncbi:hypothetical protein N0V86_004837 [Didymella sp. IMI 355093]|nr:hypothetical protein N0V86_004837 [Didymella sp. IMI 355093]
MREPSCSAEAEDRALGPSAHPTAPALQETTYATSRTPTPSPTDVPPPHLLRRRGAVASIPFRPNDTRRHGMVLANPSDDTPSPPMEEDLPTYTPMPYTPFRRVTHDGTLSPPIDARTLRSREARQRELRELQRQWNVRRRTHPTASSELPHTERTRYRPLVSEAFDLPPPYAPSDPYPLFHPGPRRPSLVSRVLLYPFVPEGKMLDRAATKTDQWAAMVKCNVKTGVKEVGKKAKAVPKHVEEQRARRKIREYPGVYHINGAA